MLKAIHGNMQWPFAKWLNHCFTKYTSHGGNAWRLQNHTNSKTKPNRKHDPKGDEKKKQNKKINIEQRHQCGTGQSYSHMDGKTKA